MTNEFFAELARCLRKQEIDSKINQDKRLEVFLHGQPVLFVSPKNEVFLLPEMSGNDEAGDLYHEVAQTADEVWDYVEAVQTSDLLSVSGLSEDFHLLADFGGALLAGREREQGSGYQFVTWIWDYYRTGVCYLTAFDLRVQRQNLAEQAAVIGRVTFANGEQQDFTDAEAYLQCIREELPDRPITGFRYETLTDVPTVRKQVDDILYDLYGEENPRTLEDYQEQPDQGVTMGGI